MEACSMKYEELGTEIGRLVDLKNAAYGASFDKAGDVLRILYPNGITPDQYVDALAVVRILDKLFRTATDRDALGESPFGDIAGYGLLGAARAREAKSAAQQANAANPPRCRTEHVSGDGGRCLLDLGHKGPCDFSRPGEM
jgi:hypothetical protein